MTDCVHAAVDSMQASGSHAPSNGTATQPSGLQLLERNDPVLAGGQMRDHPVACGTFLSHTVNKAPQARILPLVGEGLTLRGGLAVAFQPSPAIAIKIQD